MAEIVIAILAAFAAYGDNYEARGAIRKKWSRMIQHVSWAAGVIILIGLLLIVVMEAPIMTIMASRPFIIGGVIALVVAVLESWPSDRD